MVSSPSEYEQTVLSFSLIRYAQTGKYFPTCEPIFDYTSSYRSPAIRFSRRRSSRMSQILESCQMNRMYARPGLSGQEQQHRRVLGSSSCNFV